MTTAASAACGQVPEEVRGDDEERRDDERPDDAR